MPDTFHDAVLSLTDDEFLGIYGPWQPMTPVDVAGMLGGCEAGWHIAGGRAARVGVSAERDHADTDVVVLAGDLDAVRSAMREWHLWENYNGTLRPLLPGVPDQADCHQVWVRRDARSPWRMEFLVDRLSTADEWVFKHDESVRVPWDRALRPVDGIWYLRPELAMLFKAKHNREKDRADLAAARLDPEARRWLAATLDELGYAEWALLARQES